MKHSESGKRVILVVEDEPAIAQVCLRTLTAEGFEVDIAVNGAIAQDMLAEKDYDLCLIDIRTPIMNGKELYQHMVKEFSESANKVIFTTGAVFDDRLEALIEESKRPYLPKPFTPDELRAIVRKTLGG
jgi:DNA-binding response OmpR family regulator